MASSTTKKVVVRRFERPDARFQPIEEREIVRHASKQDLAKVDMGLHQTRKDRAATRVEDPRRTERGACRRGADRRDSPGPDEHVPFEGAILAVARDDRSAGNEQVHAPRL